MEVKDVSKHVYWKKESEKMLSIIKQHFGLSSDSEGIRLAVLKTYEGISK